MDELVAFLKACIAEDAAIARAVPLRQEYECDDYGLRFLTNESDHSSEDTAFVTCFNPIRVLAECEAKRTIIETFEGSILWGNEDAGADYELFCLLAQPYAARTGFKKEWAV